VIAPIGKNPLLNAMMFDNMDEETEEMRQYREKQKESELNLLGTMLVQAVVLAACIVLYTEWEWSHFGSTYESALFYGMAGFSVQAAFYFTWRAVFEDSQTHRRQLKRMRNSNRRQMGQLKFQQEKAQLQAVLNQQMGLYQQNLTAALADNVITPQESEVLGGNLQDIQTLMAQLQALQGQTAGAPQQAAPLTPESLGIDRHRIMGIPVGPKLTVEPTQSSSAASNVLNLQPTGTQDQVVLQEAQALEEAAGNL